MANKLTLIVGDHSANMRATLNRMGSVVAAVFPEATMPRSEHAKIAESFLDKLKHEDAALVTHSDVIPLRIRRAILERRISFEQVEVFLLHGNRSPLLINWSDWNLDWIWPADWLDAARIEKDLINRMFYRGHEVSNFDEKKSPTGVV
jgi:hypothetical protein